MLCEDTKLRIHFELNGKFSSFNIRKPTDHELKVCDRIFITPDSASWDPYSEHFSRNEESILDCNGNLIDLSNRQTPIPPPHNDPYYRYSSVDVIDAAIYEIINSEMNNSEHNSSPSSIPENRSLPNDEAYNFAEKLLNNDLIGKISIAFRMMSVSEEYMTGRPLFTTTLDNMENMFESEISALEASKPNGTTPEHIKKICFISDKEAKSVIEANTQLNCQSNDWLLSRHFSTNDQILRYRQINSYFFTDTLLVTTSAKLLRGYLYLRVFVSNKCVIAFYLTE